MGHMAVKQVYRDLQDRLNKMPVGAPGEGTIYEILKIVFSEEDAAFAARMPMKFASLRAIARRMERPEAEVARKLEDMSSRGLVMDFDFGGKVRYLLNPTVVGFFEFSMMRIRDDIDQKKLARLIYRYVVEEPDFSRQFKPGTQTSLFRTLVHEDTLEETHTEVLDWERASHLLDTTPRFSVGICHCRHSAQHMDHECQIFPIESCLTMGSIDWVLKSGLGREIDREEARDLLTRSKEAGMVHLCDNVQQRPTFVCNCCGCCCEVLLGFKKFRFFGNTFSSNFEACVSPDACTGCGKCVQACPVQAIELIEHVHQVGAKTYKRLARVDLDTCLGCGVCARACKFESLEMAPRPKRRIAPADTFARVLTMALEQGKLHHLLIDAEQGMTAQAASAMLGAILKLPPAKQILAQQTIKSRFVDFLLSRARQGSRLRKSGQV